MKKPVLTIFYQFNPWHTSIGGIQTVIRTFIKHAPPEFEIRLAGTGHRDNQPLRQWQDAEFAGRELKFMPLFIAENDDVRKLVPTSVRYTLALLRRRLESDFMHFHRLEPSLVTLNWVGDKTLFIHNDIHEQIHSKRKTILWQRFPQVYYALERSLIGQFNQVYSCNTDSVKYYQQRYPALHDRVTYLKNTVDVDVFYPLTPEQRERGRRDLTKRFGLPETTQFILFAGRLHPQKDPLLLIRSMAALNLPGVHLLIAGNGELAGEVQMEIQRFNLGSQITLLGAVSQSELAQLHRVCSAFVLTSLYEGLPIVALEALASGTPIVTTRCGETPNLLTPRSGVVCDLRTERGFAEALRQVLLNSTNYPAEACRQAAQPYAARTVVHSIFDDMWERWQMNRRSAS